MAKRSQVIRSRTWRWGVGAAVLCGCSAAPARPNIVLIFTDDQGYADVGVYGAVGLATPNLDRLAGEGVRFTNFYASQGVCSASRASLLTGSYAERVSVVGAYSPSAQVGLHPDEETIAELLRREGYATGMVGKWHLGHHDEFLPMQQGFDEYFGLPYSNDMWPVNYDGTPATEGNKINYPPLPLIEGNERIETVADLADQDRLTTRYTERAVDFIARHAGRPFFLYFAHSMPHVPLGVSDTFRGHSAQGMYGDVIEEIDWSVGKLLDALDRHGLAENTLVFFASDNGPWLNYGNHAGSTGPLREGKGTAYEGGPRVPAIARWPGRIPAGGVTDQLASTIDVLPTIADVIGARLPERPIDGVSILSILEGDRSATPRTQFFFYYTAELRAVREGHWKRVFEHRTRSYAGVEPGNDGYPGPYAFPTFPAALYDLDTDPGETADVAADHPDVVARLEALADSVRASLGDRLTQTVGRDVRPVGRRRFDRADSTAHIGIGASVSLSVSPGEAYAGHGPSTLTDGRVGTRDVRDGQWLGFRGDDVEVIIDLGSARLVTSVSLELLEHQTPWIFLPRFVEISVSGDGVDWATAYHEMFSPEPNPEQRLHPVTATVASPGVRFVRLRAENLGANPEWHATPGGAPWIFLDEVVIR